MELRPEGALKVQGRISRRLPSGIWVGRVLATILLLGSLLGSGTVVIAAETGADAAETDGDGDPAKTINSDNEKWQPALGMGFVLVYQDQEGSQISGPGADPIPAFPGFEIAGTGDSMVSPGFRFDASLASPVLFESFLGPFAPRVFAQVGTQLVLEDKFIAWRSAGSLPVGSQTIETLLNSSIDSQWYLGAGLEFRIPAGERFVRLRTSVDYMSQTISIVGQADVTTKITPPGQQTATYIDHYQSPTAESTYHAVGVGVAAEADVYSWRGMRVSLFLETRFAWLSDRDTMTVTALRGPCDIVPGTGQCVNPLTTEARFAVTPGAFIAQGGGGIRIRWVPVW
jgi:hypothetical protein